MEEGRIGIDDACGGVYLLVGDSRRGLMSKEERVAEVLRISQSPAPEITLRNYTYDWTWRFVKPS
jgi:hypothetical protein